MKKSLVEISNDLVDIIAKSKASIKKLSKEFLSNGIVKELNISL
jgi:hypothetical protein